MKLFTKLASMVAGVAAAVAFTAASAAPYVTSPNTSTLLTETNPIIIGNDDLAVGSFTDSVSFDVDNLITSATGAVDVRFSSGIPAGVANMVITFQIAGLADQSFTVTDSAGMQTLFIFSLLLNGNNPVTTVITGTVFENIGQNANYDIVITAAPIPLPAAGVFLLTGLAGAAGLRLRKKAA